MSKELEHLKETLSNISIGIYQKVVEDISYIEKELKALEIIKEKKVDVGWLLHYINLKKDDYTPLKWYNENLPLIDKDKELTHEEFDLLKEVLL